MVGLHVTGIEAFWIFITYLGFIMTLFFLKETLQDKKFLKEHGINGARFIVANANIRRQSLRVTAIGCLSLSATIAALTNPATIPEWMRTISLLSLTMVPILLLAINTIDRSEKTLLVNHFLQADALKEHLDAIQEQEAKGLSVHEEAEDSP